MRSPLFLLALVGGITMIKARRPKKAEPKENLQEQAMAYAQLALDIFQDKRHVVGAKSGHNNADHKATK